MELARLHQLLQRKKCRRGVADGKDAGLGQGCRPLHGYKGTGHTALLSLRRHVRVRHEAVYLSAQRGEDRLIDPGSGHLGIGDDVAARPQGGDGLLHRVVGKGQIVHIVKIRRGVDDPFDDQLIFGSSRRSPSSSVMMAKLRFSISIGFICSIIASPFCKPPKSAVP